MNLKPKSCQEGRHSKKIVRWRDPDSGIIHQICDACGESISTFNEDEDGEEKQHAA